MLNSGELPEATHHVGVHARASQNDEWRLLKQRCSAAQHSCRQVKPHLLVPLIYRVRFAETFRVNNKDDTATEAIAEKQQRNCTRVDRLMLGEITCCLSRMQPPIVSTRLCEDISPRTQCFYERDTAVTSKRLCNTAQRCCNPGNRALSLLSTRNGLRRNRVAVGSQE